MKRLILITTIFFFASSCMGQHTIYFFPGQGSDSAIFSKLQIDAKFKKVYLHYPTPTKGESLATFAKRFIPVINTSEPYSFIGVSMGGMIATELADIMQPKNVIIISSAKSKNELPFGYRIQRKIPFNKAIPAKLYRRGALLVQPIFEPDRNKEKATFKRMLSSKDPLYLKRSADMIINWKRVYFSDKIIHIHGSKDNTIPIRNVKTSVVVNKGSHMMTLTRPMEISELISHYLKY